MKIIGRADADVIHLTSLAAEFINMPVESFKFNEKIGFGKIIVDYPHTVRRIQGGKKVIAGCLYGFKMPYCNIPAQSKCTGMKPQRLLKRATKSC